MRPTSMLARLAPSGLPFARTAVRAGLGRVFGPPPVDPATDPGDPGLFGPGSASWRVVGEPAAIVGGIRSLLVQALHPLAVAGVAEHSNFRTDPLGRLQRTSAYVTTTTFGSTDQALRTALAVRAAHGRVTGVAPDGRPYDAAAPGLLRVVGVALTHSLLVTDRLYAPRPVDDATADAFVAEQSRAAALLDPRVDVAALRRSPRELLRLRAGTLRLPMIDEGLLPTDVAGLDVVVEQIRTEHAITAQTRQLLAFLLWPDLPAPVRAAYLPVLAGAVATLDRADLRLLGAPQLPLTGLAARTQTRAALTALRLATGRSPSHAAAAARHGARAA